MSQFARPESTVPSSPSSVTSPPLSALYVVPVVLYEREGREPLAVRRAALLDTLDRLVNALEQQHPEPERVTLGGGLVLLEDVGAVRPDLLARLVRLNQAGRVLLDAWYILTDEALVSGEALVRNLLMARSTAARYGMTLASAVYLPVGGGHTAQLPQILRGFGIDTAFLRHGTPIVHLPFRWEAPDGSAVLVISDEDNPTISLAESLKDQEVVEPDGPYLWLRPFDDPVPLPSPHTGGIALANRRGAGKPDLPVLHTGLSEYAAAVRSSIPDELRPALRGEIRLATTRSHSFLFPGTLSARLYLKQANARLTHFLTHTVEPLVALALTPRIVNPIPQTAVESAENLRALLAQAWRLLLQNQERAAIGGCADDFAHESHELRYREAEQTAQQVLERALWALPGERHTPGLQSTEATETAIVVWNGHNWPIRQFVTAQLELPPGKYPAALQTPSGKSADFVWYEESMTIGFVADVPPIGYSAYNLRLSDVPVASRHIPKVYNATSITHEDGSTLLIENSRLTWRNFHKNGDEISDLLRFIDEGDAGDTLNSSPPQQDWPEQAALTGTVQVEESALYKRLIMRHRMRIAPELKPGRVRERGLRLIDLTTTATFYRGMPGIYFHTTFENSASDHRLRVFVRTGLRSDSVLAGTAFDVVERRAAPEGQLLPGRPGTEGVSRAYPLEDVCAVESGDQGMAVLARGLTEFEAVREEGQITLTLTLVRSVGWITRDDLRTRTAAVDTPKAASGAQCLRLIEAEYALMPTPHGDRAALLRASRMFSAPLHAYQYDVPPELSRLSYFSVTRGDTLRSGVIMTTFKPPENAKAGEGWIVRLLNPSDLPVEVHLRTPKKAVGLWPVTLAETSIPGQNALPSSPDGSIPLKIEPHQVSTVFVKFGG